MSRRYSRDISVAVAGELKPGELSISEDAARILNVHVGSKIEWTTPGKQFSSTVARIHKIDQTRLSARIEFLLSAETLAGSPTIYYGAIRVSPHSCPPFNGQFTTPIRQSP